MVPLAPIGCLTGNNGSFKGQPPDNRLDILAFEAARTVSRLLNLYRSLSDPEIIRLRKEIFKSKGVLYLNSDDEGFLLKLACVEKIEDLDNAAKTVNRLGRKCSLNGFDVVYAEVKAGSIDLRKFEYASSKTKKKIRKLNKFLMATLGLYGSMQSSSGSELSEKKPNSPVPFLNMINFPAIEWKMTPNYRLQACDRDHSRKPKLWSQPFEKVVRSMANVVCVIYARICMVFGPYAPYLPAAYRSKQKQVTNHPSEYWRVEPVGYDKCSRPRLVRSKSRKNFVRFPSRRGLVPACGARVFHIAGPETVGGSRLQILYANLIMMAEENMSRKKMRDDVRDEMYKMLPVNLRAVVKMKIRSQLGRYCDKAKMKEALKRIFMWLSPMATNTLLWQRERRVEMNNFQVRPPVLLLQTLHFADKEKTEAAIIEVLVGLSFLYMQDNRLHMVAAG